MTISSANLAPFDLETLEKEENSIFAISADFILVYFNPAYRHFAERNGAEEGVTKLGTSVLDAIAGDLRATFEEKLAQCLATNVPWIHEYECVSHETYREFRQSVYPLAGGRGLLLLDALTIELPIAASGLEAHEPHVAGYVQETGLLTQCSNCRRTQRNGGLRRWDWVPAWVAAIPANVSHTICPPCFDFYWKPSLA